MNKELISKTSIYLSKEQHDIVLSYFKQNGLHPKNYADFIMLLMAQPKPNEDYLQLMEESCDLLSNRVQRDS